MTSFEHIASIRFASGERAALDAYCRAEGLRFGQAVRRIVHDELVLRGLLPAGEIAGGMAETPTFTEEQKEIEDA